MAERSRAYDCYAPLLAEHAALDVDDPRRAELRDRLVAGFMPVVRNIAHRYANRGEPVDDLEQVASIGLLNAIKRFDPERTADFLSYAVPTIMGEVRRYFRDSAWSVRTPRDIKDRFLAVSAATSELSQALGAAPTVDELATHLGLDRERVLEAIAARSSYQAASLDETLTSQDDDQLVDTLGTVDAGFDHVEIRSLVADLVSQLPERERTILVLRFVHEKTQSQIGAHLGISQMHVSRLLARTFDQLRAEVTRHQPVTPGDGVDLEPLLVG